MSFAEQHLIDRLRQRDEEAFNEIVMLHGNQVFNLVLRMVGNRAEAEDLAQEVFVAVFKSIDSFRAEAKFTTWLLRIAANHAKNRIKYLARRATLAMGSEQMANVANPAGSMATSAVVQAPDVALEKSQKSDIIQAAIATLDEDQRLLVILRDIEDLSYDEIVEITGLPAGTVKSRLHRARMALKDLLERRLP